MSTFVCFLLLLLLVAVDAGSIKETATGVTFSDHEGFTQQVLGLGVRTKGPFKVYAVGLYGSRDALVQNCKGCKSSKEVLPLLEKFVQDGTLVLKMVRDVGSETMAGALSDAIKPRIKGDSSALDKLRSVVVAALPTGCPKNTELKFLCSGSSVGVSVNGQKKGDISSSALSKAFIKTYVDEHAVSASLRDDIANRALNRA